MNTAGISSDSCSGFPKLKYLWFRSDYYFWDEADFAAFKYCCQNSPMLEEIHVHGCLECWEIHDSAAKSIGPLVQRPALRKLDLNIEEPEEFNDSLMNLLNCPGEKPNLEELVLHGEYSPYISLRLIYQFVNGNKNLKSLELSGIVRNCTGIVLELNEEIKEKETAISELIKILTCDNGLHEIKLHELCISDGTYRTIPIIGDDLAKKYTSGRIIKREEFPKMVEDLRNFDLHRLPFTPEDSEQKTFL